MWKYTEYLPPYLREVSEIKILGEAVDPRSTATQKHLIQTYHNQFVTTGADGTLRRRERLFKISSDSTSESLDFRRKRLINRYCMKLPLTMNFLLLRLDDIIGAGKYNAWVSHGGWNYRLGEWELGESPFRDDPYVLHIESVMQTSSWYYEMFQMVHRIKPANIVFAYTPLVIAHIEIGERIGIGDDIFRWNYTLGMWRIGMRPFGEITENIECWNYRLGDWRLGEAPFGNAVMEVFKIETASSIKPTLLADHAKLTANDVAKVRINGNYLTDQFVQKYASGDSSIIRYKVPRDALPDWNYLLGEWKLGEKPFGSENDAIRNIKLLRMDGAVLAESEVYIPEAYKHVIKHVIIHREVLGNV